MPHIVGDWPLVANVFALSSSLLTWLRQAMFIQNSLNLPLRNSITFLLCYVMYFFTSIIVRFTDLKNFLYKGWIKWELWSSNFLCFVCFHSLFLVLLHKFVDVSSTNFLYSCYLCCTSTTSKLSNNPFSFFSVRVPILITILVIV